MMNTKLTSLQAFNAMKLFLEKYYEETSSDDVASLLSELQFLEDGSTADPAAWESWDESVQKALMKKDLKEVMILKKPE